MSKTAAALFMHAPVWPWNKTARTKPGSQVFPQRIEDRDSQQCESKTEQLSSGHHHADGAVCGGACAPRKQQRNHAAYQRQGCHQNRPQAIPVRLNDGLIAAHAGRAQPVRVVDLQNCILLHNAEQQQQSQSRKNVDALPGDDHCKKAERNGQRKRD